MTAKFIGGPLNGKELWLNVGDPAPAAPYKVGIRIRNSHNSKRISVVYKSGAKMHSTNCDVEQMCEYEIDPGMIMIGRYIRKSHKEPEEHRVCYWWDSTFEQKYTLKQWKERRQPNGRVFF